MWLLIHFCYLIHLFISLFTYILANFKRLSMPNQKMLLKLKFSAPFSFQQPLRFLVAHLHVLVALNQRFHQVLHTLCRLHPAGIPISTG